MAQVLVALMFELQTRLLKVEGLYPSSGNFFKTFTSFDINIYVYISLAFFEFFSRWRNALDLITNGLLFSMKIIVSSTT